MMMKKIVKASELLKEALGVLDVGQHKCLSCGLMVKENWQDAQIATVLHKAIKLLNKLVKDELEADLDEGGDHDGA